MRNWRVLTAVAAVVLAAIAGVLVWKYVDDADERAAQDKDLVEALVAKQAIGRGTPGARVASETLYEIKEFSRESLPEGAIPPGETKDRAKRLTTAFGTRIAGDAIPRGVPLVNEQFVQPSAVQGSFTGAITEGKQAVTISVDDQHGVGGFISPGDQVNLVYSAPIHDVTVKEATDLKTTAFLLPGLKVLAVGQTTSVDAQVASQPGGETTATTAPAQPRARGLITVEVDPRQAEQIAHAYFLGGQVYLTLNPTGFNPGSFQKPAEIVEGVNFFDQDLTKLAEVQAAVKAAK